jgi:type IV pilus biogenesis protein PilP
MRIADKNLMPEVTLLGTGTAFLVMLGIFWSSSAGATAADSAPIIIAPISSAEAATPPMAPAQTPIQPSAQTPAQTSVPSAAPTQAVGIVLPAPESTSASSAPPSPPDLFKAQGESIDKNISTMEDKVSENAKNIVKHLDSGSDTTTLADLNRARQTITRIDAMIEVERRLNELEKLRNERRDVRSTSLSASLAGAIPASALGAGSRSSPAPVAPPAFTGEDQKAKPVATIQQRPEISRIYGTGGQYVAVLKFAGGEVKSVRAGDKLTDGDTVRAITSSSVDIGGKGTSYTLHVKNIDVVFSGVR